MKIKADAEGINAIRGMANVVLKTLGLDAYNDVGVILGAIEALEEEEDKDAVKKKDGRVNRKG